MKKQGSGARGQGPEKSQNPSAIMAQAVRAALWELGESSSTAVADYLEVKTFKERRLVRNILSTLVRNGGAEIGGPPEETTYRLTDKSVARGGVQAKLWEFACLRFATAKPFGAAEAARLAECDRDYTKRYYRWLEDSGYLVFVGRGPNGAKLYQVVGGKEHEPAPAWNRRAEKRKSRGQGPGVRGQVELPSIDSFAGKPLAEDYPHRESIIQTLKIICARRGGESCLAYPNCETCVVRPAGTPAAPAAAGIITRNPAIIFFDEKPEASQEAGGANTILRSALEAGCREKLDAALEDFGRALVEVAGGIDRAWEIIREMKGELLALEDQGHDEPGEPTTGDH